MKRFLAILLALTMLSALAAVTGSAETRALRLASHNAVIEGNSYRVRYEKDIQDAAAAAIEKGFDISYASFVSNWDAALETQQIQNSINEGYDIILVNPVAPTGLDPIIEKAQDAGIVYINCDCEYLSEDVNILNIATDQYYLGYKTATYAGEVLGAGAKVVMINAIEGNAANTFRENGFNKGIVEQGLEVIGYYNHDWDMTKCQQVMTEILNSGLEFEGVLVSQGAEAILAAYDAAGKPYPKFLGFGDTGEYMQRMLKINAEKEVLPYIVVSNPPGVGGSALNFGLNQLLGKTLKDNAYENGNALYHSIYLPSKIWYTYAQQEEYRALAEGMATGDAISYWLTIDEVAEQYYN
jgi:ribose transport system substrate-binding protein